MTTITIRKHAGEFERYSPTAFDAQIGHEIPFKIEVTAHVVDVHVADDHRTVDITLDVHDEGWSDRADPR